jgi:triosephosphate isomerase
MSRKPFIAGNWKMNLSRSECVSLAQGVVNSVGAVAGEIVGGVELAICPPSVYLDAVASIVKGSSIGLGAQNLYFEGNGAFTGEISAAMVKDIGCQYVILGHSERRLILGETDSMVFKKTVAALAAGLIPIVCVGETLEQREQGKTTQVVRSQFLGSLAELNKEQAAKVVLAYEPVWAIGTGKVATPAQAEEVHADLRKLISSHFGAQIAEGMRIQYGGSVKPDNAKELLGQPNIDGALVGGASLKADSFLGIAAGLA